MKRRDCLVLAIIMAGLGLPADAAAEGWPTRPVTMVIPFGAGSGIDVLGRVLAPALSEQLGQQVVIENVGGAGGMTGVARVAHAAPDGYQVVLGNVGTHAHSQALYAKPLYNAADDFTPVGLVADTPQVLITRADFPADDLKAFVAYAKANHAKLQFGSPGAGSAAHLGCVLLDAAMGVEVVHVPYKGGGPAMQDLLAGRIDYQCPLLALALPQIEARKVKAMAMLTRTRSDLMPELASAAEQGLNDVDVSTWNALFLPKGTPAAVVARLHAATVAALDAPGVREQLRKIGAEPTPPARRSAEFLRGFVRDEVVKWTKIIKAAGATVE
jgi:tripartite-type tricarboxylate transporter receptor subunit TctC